MICASCGRTAEGYATGRGGERLCHSDDRWCYRDYVTRGYRLPVLVSAEHGVVADPREHMAGGWPPPAPEGEGCER